MQTTTEENSVKDKIIETVAMEEKAKALQVYDDLSAYTHLTVDKRSRLIQDGKQLSMILIWSILSHTTLKERKKDKNCPLLRKYFLLQRNKRVLRKASYWRVVEKEVALKNAGFIYKLSCSWTIEYKFVNRVHELNSWTIEYVICVYKPSSWTEFMNWVHELSNMTYIVCMLYSLFFKIILRMISACMYCIIIL